MIGVVSAFPGFWRGSPACTAVVPKPGVGGIPVASSAPPSSPPSGNVGAATSRASPRDRLAPPRLSAALMARSAPVAPPDTIRSSRHQEPAALDVAADGIRDVPRVGGELHGQVLMRRLDAGKCAEMVRRLLVGE